MVWLLSSSKAFLRSMLVVVISVTAFFPATLNSTPFVHAAVTSVCAPVWKQVSSPNLGEYSILNAVSAVSATNVWAVGYFTLFSVDRTLILHYDGAKWKTV